MNNMAKGWYSVDGIQLDSYVSGSYINGGIVKSLTLNNCDMMYVELNKILHTCAGNYTWTKTSIIPNAANYVFFVPIGANNLFKCSY